MRVTKVRLNSGSSILTLGGPYKYESSILIGALNKTVCLMVWHSSLLHWGIIALSDSAEQGTEETDGTCLEGPLYEILF